MESKADVIVFEYLNMKKKKRGNKQKLSMWRKRDIQHRVESLAARNGIRVSYICAVNTSRLAFDGSGKVLRGKDAGLDTYELCKFITGKVYNCDLSASKKYRCTVLHPCAPQISFCKGRVVSSGQSPRTQQTDQLLPGHTN